MHWHLSDHTDTCVIQILHVGHNKNSGHRRKCNLTKSLLVISKTCEGLHFWFLACLLSVSKFCSTGPRSACWSCCFSFLLVPSECSLSIWRISATSECATSFALCYAKWTWKWIGSFTKSVDTLGLALSRPDASSKISGTLNCVGWKFTECFFVAFFFTFFRWPMTNRESISTIFLILIFS